MLFDRGARYFRMLGRRGRTVLFQLPLSGTMLLVILLASVLHAHALPFQRSVELFVVPAATVPGTVIVIDPGPFVMLTPAPAVSVATCGAPPVNNWLIGE